MRKPTERKLNFTFVFCEDEEENEIAFEHAVKSLLLDDDKKHPLN